MRLFAYLLVGGIVLEITAENISICSQFQKVRKSVKQLDLGME